MKRCLSIIVVISVLLLLSFSSGSQPGGDYAAGAAPGQRCGVWTQTSGPPGGYIWDIVAHPTVKGLLYAVEIYGGIYKSVNGGASWTLALKIDDPDACYDFVVAAGAVVYAGISRDLYKSDDYGETWQKVYERIDAACAIDPTSTDTVYVGAQGGVAKTTDGGQTWTRYSIASEGFIVNALAINPITPTIIYAGGEEIAANKGEIYKSMDGGISWTQVLTTTYGEPCISRIAIDPDQPSTVYAGGWISVYKSTDGGASWEQLEVDGGLLLNLDPYDPQIVYAGGNDVGLFRSLDGGLTWEEVVNVQVLYNPRTLALDPNSPNTLYIGNPFGIYKSMDGGDSWAKASAGISYIWVDALATGASGTLFASCLDSREVFKSTDRGATWTVVMSGAGIRALAVDPLDPNVVYAGGDEGLYKSVDGGFSWRQIYLAGRAFAFDPTSPTTLYAGGVIEGQWGIARSTNGGESWTSSPIEGCIEINAIAVDAFQSTIIYVGGKDERWQGVVWKSTNGGESWQRVLSGVPTITAVVADPNNPNTVFAGTRTGIYKSTDGGVIWWQAVCPECSGYRLVFDPYLPDTLYAGGHNAAVHKSQDGGATWNVLPSQLGGGLESLAIGSEFPRTIYAGLIAQGVWSFTECVRGAIYLPVILKSWHY